MKKAFTVFPSVESEDAEDGDDDVENSNLWKDVSEDY